MLTLQRSIHSFGLSDYPKIFAALSAPETLVGTFSAEFTGPAWLRAVAGPGLWPLGLGGWCGKQFAPDGFGVNLVKRGGAVRRVLPIRLESAPSLVDGRPCLSVRYLPENPFPWPHVVDELRWLDAKTLLGLTLFNAASLHRWPLPFLLHQS